MGNLIDLVGPDCAERPGDRQVGKSKRWWGIQLILSVQILQRGQEISKREWKLLNVAVVALSENAYVARLFFGDAETGALCLTSKIPTFTRIFDPITVAKNPTCRHKSWKT